MAIMVMIVSHLVIMAKARSERLGVGVLSKHQQVNLCYYASGPDGMLKRHRFILVQAECPYVQFMAAARVISTKKFVVGVTNGERGIGPKSLMKMLNWC